MKYVTRMMVVLGIVAIVFFLARADGLASGQQPGTVFAFVNTSVIPMDSDDQILTEQTVVVQGDRIYDLGPAGQVEVPAGATRIDGAGKYLMPGLSEMHGHTVGGDASETFKEQVMFLYAANGVTTVRGMLGLPGDRELKAKTNSGEIWGPTLYLAGPSFNGRSVESVAQAEQKVRDQKAEGWDHLKIHGGLSREEYDAIARTAAEAGIRFGGHVPSEVGLEHALRMGQETMDHLDGYLQALDAVTKPINENRLAELVELTKSARAWVVPTMVLWEVGVIGLGNVDELKNLPEMRYWPATGPGSVESWVERHNRGTSSAEFNPELAIVHARNRRQLLKALSDGGVGILMGTDSPQLFSVPGFSLHREMQAMADAGMSPYEILKSGTKNVGDYFQRFDSFGTVGVGRRADLLLLNSNPLDAVANVADRAGVMVRGRWMSEADIQGKLAEIADTFSTN